MNQVTLVEVGPRDGFQAIAKFIPTAKKIEIIESLARAGLRRIEIGSFVSPKALPQLADIREIIAVVRQHPEMRPSVLVPNAKGVELALAESMHDLAYVVSASESHNRRNVRRSVDVSVGEARTVLANLPRDKGLFRLNVATCFDCPFEGRIPEESVLAIVERVLGVRSDIEVCLADTTGAAIPTHVDHLFARCMKEFGNGPQWAFHCHDTYGFGVANVLAALNAGVRVIDSSIGGIGGCPYAPGATGNVATEDVVYTVERLGYSTGIDLIALLDVAEQAAAIDGAGAGGHIRDIRRGGSDRFANAESWRSPATRQRPDPNRS